MPALKRLWRLLDRREIQDGRDRPSTLPPAGILSKFASGKGLTLTVTVEATPEGGISKQKLEETKVALRESGLNDDVVSN